MTTEGDPGGVTVHAVAASVTVPGPLRMQERDSFSWRIVYLRMRRHLRKLREMHDSDGSCEKGELYAEVDSFFLDCNHLRDWMRKDASSPHALPAHVRDRVEKFAKAHESLRFATGFANTSKHAGRDEHNKSAREDITARITEWHLGTGEPRSVRIKVDYWERTTAEIDALDLAERCAAEWERFLIENGQEVPQ